MKKNFLTYLFFISAFVCFVLLRVFAGKNIDGTKANTTINPDESIQEAAHNLNQTIPVTNEDAGEETVWEEIEGDFLTSSNEDEWHGDFTPIDEFSEELPRIICWGDSLTVSVNGKNAYPDVLRKLSGCEVINYGVESENTAMIAMREGGVRVNVKATVIPSERQMIPVFLQTENGGHVSFFDYGEGGVNPCSICGIEGRLEKLNGSYYFTRNKKGERISVPEGTQLKTFGINDSRPSDVLVIFAGTNDLPNSGSVNNIIKLQKAMLEAANCDKYVIVGLTCAGKIPEIDEVNRAMAEQFGDNFLDIRTYMLKYGVEDAGLSLTEGDLEDIARGEIPRSLRTDYVHGNSHFYRLLGEQVYRKMQYLGYLPTT